MGLVQGREDGQHGDSLAGGRTSPGMEASVSQDLFPFLSLFPLHTHVPFLPISPAHRDKGAGSISISEGKEQRLVATELDSKAQERTLWGTLCIKWPQQA